MKKFKRILSAILIAAMALSLMPTFASAEVRDSIVYDFNTEPTDTTVTSSDWSATSVTSYTDAEKGWMYYDMTAGSAKAYLPQKDPNYVQITTSVGQYFAVKIKVPESGKYTMSLVHYQHSTIGGAADLFLLPGTTEKTDIATVIENTKAVNSVLCYAEKNTYPAETTIATDYQILAGEYVLVFKATGISPYMTDSTHISKQYAYMFPASLTLTKTAEADDNEEENPPAEETKTPITLTFNKTTVDTGDNQKSMNALKVASTNTDFTIVADKTMGTADVNQYTRANAVNLNFRYNSKSAKNWLYFLKNTGEVEDTNVGKFTVQANNIPTGTYQVQLDVTDNLRGAGVYVYVDGEYTGYCDTYISSRAWNASPTDTDTKDIGYITVIDEDNNTETPNTVEIAICSASIDASTATSNYLTLKAIKLTPVDAIPAYGELSCTVGSSAAEASYSVENGATLSVSAMLSGKHLNGYKLDGTKDTDNYIKVSSSNESIVSVKDTEAALTSAEIYASGYKPVYSLVAKAGGTAIITVEAIVDGKSVASKTFTVEVEKSDIDEYDPEAVFAWGTTLPDALKDNVTVTEKGCESINAGEITASKGTTYELSVTPEITDGETTYKFIGWKRGATSDGAAAFTEYEASAEYTVWSNTYLTAVYEEITSTGDRRVEFYDQDGYYLGYKTEQDLKENGLPSSNPKLLGHTFSKWQYVENGETKEFTKDTELTEAVTRVVALQNPSDVTITYQDENGNQTAQKTYGYNTEVNAAEDCGISNVEYWRWVVGSEEKTVRTDAGYTFYAWADAILKAYTVSETETTPKVVLHGTNVDGSYMIEYDRFSSAYTVVEAGILLGDTDSISLLSCDKKYTSAKGGKSHGQYAAPCGDYSYVRGYIIYKTNSTGALSVVYTDTAATK